jgi:AraC family transcriptional regulator
MTASTRFFDGPFGRLVLGRPSVTGLAASCPEPRIVFLFDGAELAVRLGEFGAVLTRNEILLLNSGESAVPVADPAVDAGPRMLVFQASGGWLSERFPAIFGTPEHAPFRRPVETVTRRLRRLADALSIEVVNDQFLSTERLEFMLQELTLSVVESFVAKRKSAAPLWEGSRFADSRIRHALALLRAQPNKELNMDRIATAVGLSRSRFYDLFQLCTGISPRAYLDFLCVETAITRLAAGESRISEVSAELGFSAQSNFTRFFLNQVGVPPSTYRRASFREEDLPRGGVGERRPASAENTDETSSAATREDPAA